MALVLRVWLAYRPSYPQVHLGMDWQEYPSAERDLPLPLHCSEMVLYLAC